MHSGLQNPNHTNPSPNALGETTKSTPEPQVSALLFSHTEDHESYPLPSELSSPPWVQKVALSPPTTAQSLGSGLGDPSGIIVLCPQDPAQLSSTWLLSYLSPAVSSPSMDVQSVPSPYQANPSQCEYSTAPHVSPCWFVSRCSSSCSALPPPLLCSFYGTHFAGTFRGASLGLPCGTKLPTRKAGIWVSIATSHKGVREAIS